MKVINVNFSDVQGGAARAAFRIHQAVRREGVNSTMEVVKATSGDWTVSCPDGSLFKLGTLVRPQVATLVRGLLKGGQQRSHSPSLLPSVWPKRINRSNADLVHLHWLNAEMMSVEDIGRIRRPIVWTLHDMWAFCGAEHVSSDGRWREGYTAANRPAHESGFDLNRSVWQRKRNAWKRPFQIVTPSRWLADCVQQSALLRDWPVTCIPNAIDTEIWQPIEREQARKIMGLPHNTKLIAFGAMGGGQVHHKGYDLLLNALGHLRGQIDGLELIVFGMPKPRESKDLGFKVYYTGHLHDDISLRILYSAADAMIIPSRIDNLPNTGVEAMACGTPIVAFNICGLTDIVSHQKTGWLANPFDTEDLASGIQWVLADEFRNRELGQAARLGAVEKFSYPVVAAQYITMYNRVLGM